VAAAAARAVSPPARTRSQNIAGSGVLNEVSRTVLKADAVLAVGTALFRFSSKAAPGGRSVPSGLIRGVLSPASMLQWRRRNDGWSALPRPSGKADGRQRQGRRRPCLRRPRCRSLRRSHASALAHAGKPDRWPNKTGQALVKRAEARSLVKQHWSNNTGQTLVKRAEARDARPCRRAVARPAKHWSNTGQTLVKNWSNTGQTLVKHWSNAGAPGRPE
jgi:hypothetical protein